MYCALIKQDVASLEEMQEIREIYEPSGYRVAFISARMEENIDEIRELLEGKTTTVAGPSGVGKSSLIKLSTAGDTDGRRGQSARRLTAAMHTTRHSELITVDENTYIMDTPGFSSLYTNDFEKEELKQYFPEFEPYEGQCRFNGCDHVHEPDCAVKRALEEGKISQVRYQNYLELYKELKEKRRY